jgi:hypothetical protein
VLRQKRCCTGKVFIAVSGYAQQKDRRRSQDASFDHRLVKPADHHALITLVAQPLPLGKPASSAEPSLARIVRCRGRSAPAGVIFWMAFMRAMSLRCRKSSPPCPALASALGLASSFFMIS